MAGVVGDGVVLGVAVEPGGTVGLSAGVGVGDVGGVPGLVPTFPGMPDAAGVVPVGFAAGAPGALSPVGIGVVPVSAGAPVATGVVVVPPRGSVGGGSGFLKGSSQRWSFWAASVLPISVR